MIEVKSGEIPGNPTTEDVRELSKKYIVPYTTIRNWILGRIRPRLI